MSEGFPVYFTTGTGRVRVGTAYKEGDGFTVSLGSVAIGATPDAPSTQRWAPSGDSGAVFPNYGRSKGAPVRGAAMQELEYYAANARKSIADPSKARWREKKRRFSRRWRRRLSAKAAAFRSGAPLPWTTTQTYPFEVTL